MSAFTPARLAVAACGFASALFALGLTGCSFGGKSDPGTTPATPGAGFEPILSPAQVAVVRQTFPLFRPELFAPGTNPSNPASLLPDNFSPAQFLGAAGGEGWKPTPSGILVETHGYDQYPTSLPAVGTYFGRDGQSYGIQLVRSERSALNTLQAYMGLPQTRDPNPIQIDLAAGKVDPLQLESELLAIRSSLAQVIPAIGKVDPANCRIVIEPSIFYVTGSIAGNVWASGATFPLDAGRFEIHLAVFYIKGSREILNWQDVLVDEALNFYVASVGRWDLIH